MGAVPLAPLFRRPCVKGMRNNRIRQFYGPPLLYTTLAVDKLNGRGLSNTARSERLTKKNIDG